MKKATIAIFTCMVFVMLLSACRVEITPTTPTGYDAESAFAPTYAQVESPAEPPAEAVVEPLATYRVITQREIPQVMQPPRITPEMELEYYPTLDIETNIFFESGAAKRSAILAENGTLYFGNQDGQFYAVDIGTGQILWTFYASDAVQTRPALVNEKIIFNVANSLYILNSTTGELAHAITRPSSHDVRMSADIFAFNDTHVAVANGVAYFVALNGDLIAVNIVSGEIAWVLEANLNGLPTSGVDYYNGMVYFIGFPGNLFGVSAHTGEIVFVTHIRNPAFNPMTIYDGRIYIGGRSMRFYSIDAYSGEVLWRSHSTSALTWFSGGSVLIGNSVFAGTSDEYRVTVFDKDTGEFQRSYPIRSFGYTPPLRHGNNLVVISTNIMAGIAFDDPPGLQVAISEQRSIPLSYAIAIDTQNHTKLRLAPIEDTILSPPTIYQGMLFFGSDSGTVYRIDLE